MEEGNSEEPRIFCDVCGSNEFNSEGGFYYCTVCHTQSQQTREYADDELQPAQRSTMMVKTSVLGRRSARGRKKPPGEDKHLLTTWETSNKVIKAMTEKLIDVGFPAILRDKVFQLWKAYLLRRGVLLRQANDDSETPPFAVTASEYGWNLRVLYDWRTFVKPRKKKQKPKSDSRRAAKMAATKSKNKAFESTYLDSQEMEELNDTGQLTKKAPPKVKVKLTPAADKAFKFLLPGRKLGINKPSDLRQFGHQTGRKVFTHERLGLIGVIIILFIACRQIGCRVLFSDFIRLICDGTLYIRSINDIEADFDVVTQMKEHLHDQSIATTLLSNLNPVKLCERIQVYLDFLGIKRFLRPTFQEFLPKFAHDSSLPLEFELMVKQLNLMFPDIEDMKDLRGQKIFASLHFLIEIKITAMLTFVLRLLFGLDDHTEKHQSRFAAKVNEILSQVLQNGEKAVDPQSTWSELFDIKEWFRHIRYRNSLVQQEGMSPMSFLFGKPPNLTRAHDFSLRFAPREDPDDVASDLPVSYMDPSNTEPSDQRNTSSRRDCRLGAIPIVKSLKEIFKSAAVKANEGPIPEVADYISLPYPYQTVVEQFQRANENVAYPNFGSTLLFENFRKKRIDFIYYPEKYIPILEKAGYKVKVLPGTAPLYQKELKLKHRRLILFQPFKRIDESTVTPSSAPSSLQFVLDFMSRYVYYNERHTGFSMSDHFDKEVRDLLDSLSKLYAIRSRDGYIPLV